jgi:hypothetical protein
MPDRKQKENEEEAQRAAVAETTKKNAETAAALATKLEKIITEKP